jgi:FeS assembly protein IscX
VQPLPPLTWDDTYTISRLLRARHPDCRAEDLSLMTIYRWTLELPGFEDDPQLANDSILQDILKDWFEEANPV